MTKTGRDHEAERAARDWLAKHDAKGPPAKRPSRERWQRRKKAQRALERRALAKPLLKGVE